MEILDTDLHSAIEKVVLSLHGIDRLYDRQVSLLKYLLRGDNIFFTSPTNSGKTIPAVIFPKAFKSKTSNI